MALALDLLFVLLGRPYGGPRLSGLVVYGYPVPLQVAVAAFLVLGLSGRMEQFEFSGARSMHLIRLMNVLILTVLGICAATAFSLIAPLIWGAGAVGTVGQFASVRALLGLFGVGLLAAAFVDVRVAWLFAIPFAMLPLTFDLAQWGTAGEAVGFVLADADSTPALLTALGLWSLGAAAHVALYSERQAPSTNRRAILDARTRPRRHT